MPRCEQTDLPAEMCAHCLGHTDPDQQASKDRAALLATARGWFVARWPGTCEHCGEPFEAGDAIHADGALRMEVPTGWRAECCPTT
jgi:hypothetical protein